MRNDEYYMTMLERLANSIPRAGRAQIAACIVHKNTVAAYGFNQMKSHPFQARFGRNSDSIFLHAETDAIKNALKVMTVDDLAKSTLYVYRVKKPYPKAKHNIAGMSKPCVGCARAISTFGIRRVVWSLDNHGFACNRENTV
jgi:tRNA(Arg) A34 adenosine deaminase TadA